MQWLECVKGSQVLPLIESDAKFIRVEAGPGTGKTFGLVRRVQRIVHRDGLAVPGTEVLIVAFNRAIANELADEIQARLSETPHVGEPVIRTVHALSLEILGEDLRLLLKDERLAMLFDVRQLSHKKLSHYANIAAIEQALSDHEAGLKDHLTLWQAVQQWLVRQNARLISEIPSLLLSRIEGGDFTSEKYSHVIVDEFQDLTPAEQQLVLRLRSIDGSLLALGDPRQSIYAFRGNDPQGLSKLDERLEPDSEGIIDLTMTECQRCPREVVVGANRLMSLYGADEMKATSDTTADIHVVTWRSPQREARGMAKAIVEHMRRRPDETHLVMVTRHWFGYMLRESIHKLDSEIPVDINFSESLLDRWPTREVFNFFCLLADPDQPTWRTWLGYQNSPPASSPVADNRNAGAYLRFFEKCEDEITEAHVRNLAGEPKEVNRGHGGGKLWDRAQRFIQMRAAVNSVDPESIISSVLDPAGPVAASLRADERAMSDIALLHQAALDSLDKQDEEISPDARLRTVARELRHSIATREPLVGDQEAPIQIKTLWGAKGITAHHVYALGLFKEVIPGKRRASYPGTNLEHEQEQRRLFYVSITRTKESLVLSRPLFMRSSDARDQGIMLPPRRGDVASLGMCPFLQDISPVLPDAVSGDDWSGLA